MGNPLKKTMVYLGLADEEEVYEERPRPPPSPTSALAMRAPVATRTAARSPGPRR